MTPVRKLAKGISCFVVRFTSAESKDWATATDREIEFIENDWAALRWALGSTRILLSFHQVPISSLADVGQAARQFVGEIRQRTFAGCAICLFETAFFVYQPMRNSTQRFGRNILIGAMLYMVLQLVLRRGLLSVSSGSPVSPGAFRLELQRQREFHSGLWLWSRVILLIPGFVLLCRGLAAAHPALARQMDKTAALFCLICVLAIPLNLRVARKYQQRIADLDRMELNEN